MKKVMAETSLSKPLKNLISLSAQTLRKKFGSTSYIFHTVKNGLEFLWAEVEDEPSAKVTMNSWSGTIEALYGHKPDISLFLDHTYLNVLAKIMTYLKFNNETNRGEILDVISGKYFIAKGITNFLKDDFSLWLLSPNIGSKSSALFWSVCEELASYDFSKIDEDVFGEIYEEIVGQKERHKVGEYYTPEWLVEIILNEVLSLWEEKRGGVIPQIIDPACGSGIFLRGAVRMLRKRGVSFRDIIKNVAGVDINPMAVIIAKANYLIAIGDLIEDSEEVLLPVYTKDCLKSPSLFDGDAEIGEYDIVIGNPPWVVMRSVGNKEYQNFLKKEVLKYHLVGNKAVHLFTQMELATLFFCKSADLYLKRNGIIGFVMPRSVIAGTIHHVNFRKFKNPPINLVTIIDLEEVIPLFNMPSCVLIGLKDGETKYPVLLKRYTGELPGSNVRLSEAQDKLSKEAGEYTPPDFSVKPSYYHDKFKVGASIFPRALYFVDIISGKNSEVTVKTSSEIYHIVKNPWKVVLEGRIEK